MNKRTRPAGIGTGYLSLMMVFVILCLTMLAALSFSAAESERKYSEKSAEYTKLYYAADSEAKRTLAAVAEIAEEYDDYTDFMFLAELDSMENISYENSPQGVRISWSTAVNERQEIRSAAEVTGKGIEITEWRTVQSGAEEEAPLNVWLGE